MNNLRIYFGVAVLSLVLQVGEARAAYVTVGVLNPNGETLLSGLTGGAAADTSSLESAVQSAFVAGTGGVIDFEPENGGLESTSGVVVGTYGGGNKSLTMTGNFTSTSPLNQFANAITSSIPATSGTRWLTNLNDAEINFAISDSSAMLSRIGFVLQRQSGVSGANGDLDIEVLYGGGVPSSNLTVDYTLDGSAATGFFFDFVAPANSFISGLAFRPQDNGDSTQFYRIDDFAFTTSASAVPEPGSATLLASLFVFAARFRRRFGLRAAKSDPSIMAA